MGDLILLVGMLVAMLAGVVLLVLGVWNLVTLHWLTMLIDLGAACLSAAMTVAFSRAQRKRD